MNPDVNWRGKVFGIALRLCKIKCLEGMTSR